MKCTHCGKEMLEDYDKLTKETYYQCPDLDKNVEQEIKELIK